MNRITNLKQQAMKQTSIEKDTEFKSPQTTNAGEGMEKSKPSYTVGGNVS